ncbi:Histidine kinase [Catalinimonas alkaloidigena]|uniref:Histidine kinase n=1 Tax=Catalinimonas alkaloidigena TaxID=1075417 RepID=A0A1G9FB22_9BACT|nr:histidine kinase [Catalinimonas alkaloidigena]SDK85551.1 Histidine kinase [Catalinimonas alkaloidigena]
MNRLARIFQLPGLLWYNALFWTLLACLDVVRSIVLAHHLGRTFVWRGLIGWPLADYLTYWLLSLLLFSFYLSTRKLHRGWWALLHVGGAVVYAVVHWVGSAVIAVLLERLFLSQELQALGTLLTWHPTVGADLLYSGFLYALSLGLIAGLDVYHRLKDRSLHALELENRLTQAQLQALRIQMNPHFLFNALNTITMMVRARKNPEAVNMIVGLSDMLRSSLSRETRPFVTLREEMALVEQYLTIEAVRFQDRLTIEYDIAAETLPLQVPPLVLQPLVENAFKHGIAKTLDHATLRIATSVRGQQLVLEVFNSGPGAVRTRASGVHPAQASTLLGSRQRAPASEERPEGHGIGYRNTIDRLLRLYQANFKFQIYHQEGGVLVQLLLPLRETPAEAHA